MMNEMSHFGKLALSIALAGTVWADINPVQVTVSSTQALIRYGTSFAAACSLEVRENSAASPLVNDVAPTKFEGANLDSRPGSARFGDTRIFVAGKRVAERAVDSILYSRALQAATLHVYRITCGAESVTGNFTTLTVPFGQTYMDPIPPDPDNPGEVKWPHLDYADRSKTYVDPQTGALLRRVSGPSDIHTLGPNWPGTWAPPFIETYPSTGSAWSAKAFPTSVTNNAADSLILLAGGLRVWGSYPVGTTAQTYSSEATGIIDYIQVGISAKTSNAACGNTDNCKIVICLTTDGVACHPYSQQFEQALTTTEKTFTFGDRTYVNQGGWIRPGKRWLAGPETVDHTGTVTCDGTAVVTGGPFSLAWGLGSRVTINGVSHAIASIQHEGQLTLQDNCAAGTWSYSGANFGVLIFAKRASPDAITITGATSVWEQSVAPQWPAGAFFDLCGPSTVNGPGGRPGYTCMLPLFQGLYWIDSESGDTRLIGRDNNSGFACIGVSTPLDARDGTRFYCYKGDGVQSFQYVGDFADRVPGFDYDSELLPTCTSSSNPSNQPCYIFTDITNGTKLSTLVKAFDSSYDSKIFPCCVLAGVNQLNHLMLRSYRGFENTPMWTVMFDPSATSNGEPGNRGCMSAATGDAARKGCVIGAIPNWLRPEMRGQPTKGDIVANPAPGWVSMQPMLWSGGGTLDGLGFWQVKTSDGFAFNTDRANGSNPNEVPGGLNQCPRNTLGAIGFRCTGEYITTQPGDLMYYNNVNRDPVHELLRLIKKNGDVWTFERGAADNKLACEPLFGLCNSGGPVQSSPKDPILYMASTSPRAYWNYVNDPHGNLIRGDQRDGAAHGFTRFGSHVESYNGTFDPRCVEPSQNGCYGIRYQNSLNEMQSFLDPTLLPRTNVVTHNPFFHGKGGFGDVNGVQTHPAGMGHASSAEDRRYFMDARPFNGQYSPDDSRRPKAVQVTGQLWKFPGSGPDALPLDRKFLATKAQSGWHPLVDVSRPRSVLTPFSSDQYKYCVALAAGECRFGSVAGEVYFNVPYLHYNFCYFPGQAGPGADSSDICVMNQAMVQDSILQVRMDGDPDMTGANQRVLTRGLAVSKMSVPFWNVLALPNSKWSIFRTRYISGIRPDAMLLKMPPADLSASGTVQPRFLAVPLNVTAGPNGTDNAVVEFGYAENGAATDLFCTSRRETCVTGRAAESAAIDNANPFYYASTEVGSVKGTPCSNGCKIFVPAIPDRVLYYRVRYRDGGDQTVAVSEIAALVSRE